MPTFRVLLRRSRCIWERTRQSPDEGQASARHATELGWIAEPAGETCADALPRLKSAARGSAYVRLDRWATVSSARIVGHQPSDKPSYHAVIPVFTLVVLHEFPSELGVELGQMSLQFITG